MDLVSVEAVTEPWRSLGPYAVFFICMSDTSETVPPGGHHWERTYCLGEAPVPVLHNVLNAFLLLCWSLLLHSLRNMDLKKKKQKNLEPICKGNFIPCQEISIIFETESKRKGKKVAF